MLRCMMGSIRPLRLLALATAVALPQSALALTGATLRDLADPVSPGGILTYRVVLNDQTPPTAPIPVCFNPPAECVTIPVTCSNPPPSCTGTPEAGFVCQNSANDGANCGTGSPAAPNPALCIPRAQGVCNGGPNLGGACTAPDGAFTTDCPGFTFLCARAVNEDAYCGTTAPTPPSCIGNSTSGFFCVNAQNEGAPCGTEEAQPELCQPQLDPEPRPEPSFCLSSPSGVCSGGPNFGQPCSALHGQQTAECPPGPIAVPGNATVDLPLPPGTSFLDADNGGTSNGTSVVWTVPAPAGCTNTFGVCGPLTARLLVDPLVPEGALLQTRVTVTDQDGFLESEPHLTLVARMKLLALTLVRSGRGRFTYRSKFSLVADESLNPGEEEFGIRVSNAAGTIAEFTVPAGQMPESGIGVFTYRNRGAGLRAVILKELAPGLWSARVRAAGVTIPLVTNVNATVTLTLGDDTLAHQARLLTKAGGRRYVGKPPTTTTTVLAPPTTTTTLP